MNIQQRFMLLQKTAKIAIFVAAILCATGAMAAKKGGDAPAEGEHPGARFSLISGVPTESRASILDGGRTRGFLDFSLGGHGEGIHGGVFGTVVGWRGADSHDSILKMDWLGAEIGPDFRGTTKGNTFGLRIPVGIYYPLPWNRDFSGLYNFGRVYAGLGLVFDAGLFWYDALALYYWPTSKSGSIKVDNVEIALSSNEYWHARLSAGLNILGILGPVGEIGLFGFQGPSFKSSMAENGIKMDNVSYLNFGVSISALPGILSIEARMRRVLGDYDFRAVQYATGRRAIMELMEGYSIGIVGRL